MPARTDEQKAALVERILRGELTPAQVRADQGLSESELRQWVRVYRREARRVIDEQLTAALCAQGLEVDDLPATEFSGTLDSIAVADLIQTIQYGRKDAQIRIEHEGEQSHIWCVEGDVIDAQSSQLSGSGAVYRLLSLRQGRVHADFSPVGRARAIHASTQALLLESAKRYDECRQIRERLGDTSAVYVASPSAPSESEIEPEQAQVLHAFDGSRSVDEVVHHSALPDLETLSIVARLLEQRWLTLETAVRAQRQALVRQSQPSGELSFLPLAASLRARLSRPHSHGGRLWASAVAGISVVLGAFAIGFWSAQTERTRVSALALPGSASGAAGAPCPRDMSPISGRFCISMSEVTAGEYRACAAAGACDPVVVGAVTPDPQRVADARDGVATHCNGGDPARQEYPMNCVTFQQARRYCEWRGARLPSDAEWTFAAGEASRDQSGVRDLLGSVSEWTSGRVRGESASHGREVAREYERYVVLGAGFKASANAATPSRLYMNANAQGRDVGFRCAHDLAGPSVAP
jgi:hypothetical protein